MTGLKTEKCEGAGHTVLECWFPALFLLSLFIFIRRRPPSHGLVQRTYRAHIL